MRVAIIPIGNSRGVRLPKAVLEQVGLGDEAELTVEDGSIVLRPAQSARQSWAEAFAAEPVEFSEEDREWLDASLANENPE